MWETGLDRGNGIGEPGSGISRGVAEAEETQEVHVALAANLKRPGGRLSHVQAAPTSDQPSSGVQIPVLPLSCCMNLLNSVILILLS